MNFLVIDTSTDHTFIVLYIHNQPLIIDAQSDGNHAHILLKEISALLTPSPSLDFIAVGNGPGSFTGTRIGVMTAQTLSFALKTPIFSFCSLKIFTPNDKGTFTIYGDAKSRGSYCLKGIRTNDTTTYEQPTIITSKHTPSTITNFSLLTKYLLKKYQKTAPTNQIHISYLLNLE